MSISKNLHFYRKRKFNKMRLKSLFGIKMNDRKNGNELQKYIFYQPRYILYHNMHKQTIEDLCQDH